MARAPTRRRCRGRRDAATPGSCRSQRECRRERGSRTARPHRGSCHAAAGRSRSQQQRAHGARAPHARPAVLARVRESSMTVGMFDTPSARMVVGVRFQRAGRMYFFESGSVEDYTLNEWVVVRTDAGLDAGRVQLLPTNSPVVQVDPVMGSVVRKASAADQFEMNKWKRREDEAARIATDAAVERGLVTMKIA